MKRLEYTHTQALCPWPLLLSGFAAHFADQMVAVLLPQVALERVSATRQLVSVILTLTLCTGPFLPAGFAAILQINLLCCYYRLHWRVCLPPIS